jgi:hypothetical protein
MMIQIGQLVCHIPRGAGMFASPERVQNVLFSSRERLDASSSAIRELRNSLLATQDLIWLSRRMIARTDDLIDGLNGACVFQAPPASPVDFPYPN